MKNQTLRIEPKIFQAMNKYSRESLGSDLKAAFMVAIISLPMSMAFAVSSGLRPEQGVFTAIIGGIIVGLLGGSRVQIAGPTGAFLMVTQMTIAEHGAVGLFLAMIMAGLILIIMGLMGTGKLVQYIPNSVTSGFSRGIAIVIFTSQIVDFFGLEISSPKISFIQKWGSYFSGISTITPAVFAIGAISLTLMFLWPKLNQQVPNSFVVLVVISLAVKLFNLEAPVLGEINRFPAIPELHVANVELFLQLLKPALTIAVLVALQALLSAAVTDVLIDDIHDSNAELIAQGFANIACGFIGCMPSTGGVARSIANAKNGGRTPVVAITNAIILLVFMVFLLSIIKNIPRAVLAGIIIHITYNMFNVKQFVQTLQGSKTDFLIMLVTLLLTVMVNLITAIAVGMILVTLINYYKKVAESH